LQMILVAIIVHGESLTFDEANHIFAGYMMWHSGDYGLNPEHPPLVKLVATLPVVQEELWVPPLQQRMFKTEAYRDGRDFLERNDGPRHRLLFRMRLAAGVFAVGLLVTSFLMGSQFFGEFAGLLALLLVVFEPNVLANSALVTTDMGVTCFFLATIYCFYRYARQPSVLRLLLTGLAAGLTLSSKHSGILLAPMLLGLTLVEIACAEGGTAQADGWNTVWGNGSHRDRCGLGALGFLRFSLCGQAGRTGYEPDAERLRRTPQGDERLGDRSSCQLAVAAGIVPDGDD
jgi:dolichyl-phosphate-mannose--protein O-mannosyl transferase